mmetsp:Transcript_45062/g.75855  ORF Transcript_45062/g.75855 Transcript_45062/m.75855 type:complete len:231 (+) Transcript_45062:2606-3298(+)
MHQIQQIDVQFVVEDHHRVLGLVALHTKLLFDDFDDAVLQLLFVRGRQALGLKCSEEVLLHFLLVAFGSAALLPPLFDQREHNALELCRVGLHAVHGLPDGLDAPGNDVRGLEFGARAVLRQVHHGLGELQAQVDLGPGLDVGVRPNVFLLHGQSGWQVCLALLGLGRLLLAFARGRRHFWAWVSEFRFEEDSVLVEGPAWLEERVQIQPHLRTIPLLVDIRPLRRHARP